MAEEFLAPADDPIEVLLVMCHDQGESAEPLQVPLEEALLQLVAPGAGITLPPLHKSMAPKPLSLSDTTS